MLQDFINAVSAEVSSIVGESADDALMMLQAAADVVGSGAIVNYSTTPDLRTGEGAVIITFNGETSTPISVDIIAG